MRALLVWLVVAAAVACTAPPAGAEELLQPTAATGYRNGRKHTVQLVQVGWADVEVKTAKAFLLMRDAAAADGIDLVIRSGFRSHERQRWLYEAWKAGHGAKAAKPGYSVHEAGRALDLYLDGDTYAWLEKHARRFGFHRTVRGEPWHWEFKGLPRRAKRRASTAAARRAAASPRATSPRRGR